eukprot:scaffold241993_cov18-Tisochrysis_lutea.AAC.1
MVERMTSSRVEGTRRRSWEHSHSTATTSVADTAMSHSCCFCCGAVDRGSGAARGCFALLSLPCGWRH